MPTETQDSNVWRKLDGVSFDSYVPREYYYVGKQRGQQCRVLCRLGERNGDHYNPIGIFAHNVGFLPDWAMIGRDLIPA